MARQTPPDLKSEFFYRALQSLYRAPMEPLGGHSWIWESSIVDSRMFVVEICEFTRSVSSRQGFSESGLHDRQISFIGKNHTVFYIYRLCISLSLLVNGYNWFNEIRKGYYFIFR